MMKETPAGVGGREGIATPPGPCPDDRSIAGKAPWMGMGDMVTGFPCCITVDAGGEEPPGGKKTWAMAPEVMQGLALAIQSPVCSSAGSQRHAGVEPGHGHSNCLSGIRHTQ